LVPLWFDTYQSMDRLSNITFTSLETLSGAQGLCP
jgi:hypothetical protein